MSYKKTKDVVSSLTNRERFATLIAAYGAAPERWPAAERAAAERYIAVNGGMAEAMAQAALLDAALNGAARVEVPAAFEAKILADFDAAMAQRKARSVGFPRRGAMALRDAMWPGAPVWRPVAMLAASLLIGSAVGAFASPQPRDDADRTASIALDAPSSFDSTAGL